MTAAQNDRRLWTRPFLTFVLINFFIFLGFDMLLPTLTLYLEGHGISSSEIGSIYSVFTVSAVAARILTSWLMQKVKPFRLAWMCLLLCAIGCLAYYVAHAPLPTTVCRLLQGAGFGVSSTIFSTMVAQVIPPSRLGEGMGYIGLGGTAALAVGPYLGLWLMTEAGWLALFVSVAFCYVLSIVGTLTLPHIEPPRRVAAGERPPLVFFEWKVWAPAFLMFLYGLSVAGVVIFLALYFKERNLPYAADFFVLSTIGIFISRLTVGRVYDRFGHGLILTVGPMILLTSLVLVYFSRSGPLIFFAAIIYGLSTGSIFPALQALNIDTAPAELRAGAVASFFNALDVGIGLGSLSLGFLAEHSGGYGAVFVATPLMCVAFVAFYLYYYVLRKNAQGTRRRRIEPVKNP